jgi:hypothetical protein
MSDAMVQILTSAELAALRRKDAGRPGRIAATLLANVNYITVLPTGSSRGLPDGIVAGGRLALGAPRFRAIIGGEGRGAINPVSSRFSKRKKSDFGVARPTIPARIDLVRLDWMGCPRWRRGSAPRASANPG